MTCEFCPWQGSGAVVAKLHLVEGYQLDASTLSYPPCNLPEAVAKLHSLSPKFKGKIIRAVAHKNKAISHPFFAVACTSDVGAEGSCSGSSFSE